MAGMIHRSKPRPHGWRRRLVARMEKAGWLPFLCLLLMISLIARSEEIDRHESLVELSRLAADGEKIASVVIDESMTGAPKAVLLVLPSVEGKAETSPACEINRHEPVFYPLSRTRLPLLRAGLALAWMGWPAHAQLGKDGTASYDMQQSIAAVIKHVRRRWPGVELVLAGTFGGASTALAYVLKHREDVDRLLVLSPRWLRERSDDVESLRALRTLVIYDTSGGCLDAPAIEVEEISRHAGFVRLPVNQDSLGRIGNCDRKSAIWLAQANASIADVIERWLAGKPVPDHLGADAPVMTTNERVIFIAGSSGKMEVTLYTPPGPGPFPLVMFNHGDLSIEMSYVRHKQRLRDPVVSKPFLKLGFAVAVPARPGVGRSDGAYIRGFALNDGDATYKARFHSRAILAALDGLKGEADLDLGRVLLSGQSSGGYAVMYMNTLSIPGVRGIINFSGGRSNQRDGEPRSHENRMMIDGFAEMGMAAKAPVLLIFAENDARYSPNTIRKSSQAFIDAGGKAELQLFPPLAKNGHYVHHSPDKWTPAMQRFVEALHMGNRPVEQEYDDRRLSENSNCQMIGIGSENCRESEK